MTLAPDLYALIIRLIPAAAGALPATVGHLAHAAFFDILRQVDPPLAAEWHDKQSRKPFTISPLYGYEMREKGVLHVPAGREGWLRVTLLDRNVFRTFIDYFLSGAFRPAIRLADIPFQVSEILGSPHSHPLAGAERLANLRGQWDEASINPAMRSITLTFASPTAFAIRDRESPFRRMHVLPDPVIVFGELARSWDRLTGDDSREQVSAFAAQAVVVAQHNIRTRMIQFQHDRMQVGFTGDVTYEILDKENAPMTRCLNRLADLAFYTGAGSRTAMGMGQVYRKA